MGTLLLVVASALLVAAFVYEPMAGRGRSALSAYGIFSFVGGAALHALAPSLGRERNA